MGILLHAIITFKASFLKLVFQQLARMTYPCELTTTFLISLTSLLAMKSNSGPSVHAILICFSGGGGAVGCKLYQ